MPLIICNRYFQEQIPCFDPYVERIVYDQDQIMEASIDATIDNEHLSVILMK